MVFDVIVFVAAFELMLYGCMVVNRDWLLSSYVRSGSTRVTHEPYVHAGDGDAGYADPEDADYGYGYDADEYDP